MPNSKLRRRFLRTSSAVFALCFTSATLVAEHGRNFAGEFQVRNVVEGSVVVKFELHVNVFNYSGEDVKDATLTLANRRSGANPDAIDDQGLFPNVSIGYRKSVELDGIFTVPVREYQLWQRGAVPYLVVTYLDESGKELRSPVELMPAIGGGAKGAAQ